MRKNFLLNSKKSVSVSGCCKCVVVNILRQRRHSSHSRNLLKFSASLGMAILVAACSKSPIPESQSVALQEDTSIDIELSTADPSGATASYEVTESPSLGDLSGTPPILTYTPHPNVSGEDSFTYAIMDAGGSRSKSATVEISIQPVNDPPVVEPLSLEVQEDGSVRATPDASDIDGFVLRLEIQSQPKNGILSIDPTELTYVPNPDFNGKDSFTFVAVDNDGAKSEPATVEISVAATNDLPTAHALSVSLREDTPTTIELKGTDADGATLEYRVLIPPKHGTITGSGSTRTYTPNPDFHGSDSFEYAAADQLGATSEPAPVSIAVESVNDAPTANNKEVRGFEDSSITLQLEGSDSDGTVTSYEISAFPQGGTLSGSGSARTYTPHTDFYGTDSFQFVVADDRGQKSQPAVISIEVEPKNDPPTVESSHLFTAEDSRGLNITLQGNDPDGQIERFEIVRSPRHGRLRRYGDQWEYIPSRDFWGDDSFDFVAIDDEGLRSRTETVTIEVVESPDPPSISTRRRSYETHVGETIDLDVRVSDPDGDARWFSVQDRRRGANGRFFPSSGRVGSLRDLRFEATRTGSYSYRLEVEDDNGLKDWTTLTIHVRNSPPVFDEPKPRYDKKRGVVEFTLRVRDPDGRVRHFVIETIDGRVAESIVVKANGIHEIQESVPFSTGGNCEEEDDASCSLKVIYKPDEIDGHSRRIRFFAVDNEGDVSRKDFIRIETRELQ